MAPIPFPPQAGVEDAADSVLQYIDIDGMTNSELLGLMRRWNLRPPTKNKAGYLQILRDFSSQKVPWDSIRTRTTRTHKGPRTSAGGEGDSTTDAVRGKRKYKNQVTLRREEMLARQDTQPSHEGSKDVRMTQDIIELGEWTGAIVSAHGDDDARTPSPPPQHQDVQQVTEAITASSAIVQSFQVVYPPAAEHVRAPIPTTSTPSQNVHLAQQLLLALNIPPHEVIRNISHSGTPSHTSHSNTNFPHDDFPVGAIGQDVLVSASRVPQPSPSQPSFNIQLADGVLAFNLQDIPDPPALTFSTNLARLDRMWNDSSPQWDSSSPLRIKGRSIALIHWPNVYRYRLPAQWKGIKQRWSEWKFLALEYHMLKADAFWKKYTCNGKQMSMSAILEALAVERKQTNAALAIRAQGQYGAQFDELFSYRSAGQTRIVATPGAIARRYCEMHSSTSIGDSQ